MTLRQMPRVWIDFAMCVVMFALMSSQYTGMDNHEIAGALMIALSIVHHALNFRWYTALGKGKHSGRRALMTATDLVLLADLLVMAVSGIGMSQTVFRFLNFQMKRELAISLHLVSGYLGFLLMGFHFGLHWSVILGMLRKTFHIAASSKTRTLALRILAAAAVGYGVYALIKQRFFTYITLQAHFVMFDFSEFAVLYELELLAIASTTAIFGYFPRWLLKYDNSRNRKGDST